MKNDLKITNNIEIPDDATQEQWVEHHRKILTCKRHAAKWLSQSRKWAAARWGIDFVADAEVQMELALGCPPPKSDRPKLDGPDKSASIVTIQGVSQSFALWRRKVEPEFQSWGIQQLEQALSLLEPMEVQARQFRQLLDSLRGAV